MYGSSTLGTNATKCGMGGRRMKNPVWARSSSSNVTWGWFDGTFISFVNEAMNLDDKIQ